MRRRTRCSCSPPAPSPMISLSRSSETDRARLAPGGTNTRSPQCAQPPGVPLSFSAAMSGPKQVGQSNKRSMKLMCATRWSGALPSV
jgi:hypothetical protein